VKTEGIRGTLHVFPAAELALWNAAMRAVVREDPRRLASMGITSSQLRQIVEAIGEAVDDRQLTKDELGSEVARRVGRWAAARRMSAFASEWPVWQAGISEAHLAGLICYGPNRGTRVTYVRPEQWLGRQTTVAPRDALREVVHRYLAAYGPATAREIAQWLNADPRVVLDAIKASRDVDEVEVEGAVAWEVAGDRAPRARESVHLLPRFDVYVVGSHPRDVLVSPDVVARAAASGLFTRGGGSARPLLVGPTPVLMVDGRIAGIWQSGRATSRLDVRVQPFERLTSAQRDEVADRADHLATVYGASARLTFGPITTGPHL
jgi:hypothetical protein